MAAPRLSLGLSLAPKIILGLLLNVALVGVVFAAVLVVQIRINPGWLLAGRAGDRLRSIADMMASDLERAGAGEEAEVLNRYRESYELEFMLFDTSARDVADGTNTVPAQVEQALFRPRGDPANRNPNPGRRGITRPRRLGADAISPETTPQEDPGTAPESRATARDSDHPRLADGASAPEGAEARGGSPRMNRGGGMRPADTATPTAGRGNNYRTRNGPPLRGPLRNGPVPHTVLRAGTPPAYWILLPLPPREFGPPLTLVVRAQSLWSGGFLLDPQPWVLAGTGALVLSALFWLPLVRGVTRDLARITHRTEEIAAGNFDRRLGLERDDELGRLAEAIDRMASRLAHHVAGQKRFLGDAAHELSSPLARLQAIVAILESRPPSDHPTYLNDLHEELDEMAALIDELLAFSRAMHGRPVRWNSVVLRELVDRAWTREGSSEVPWTNRVPEGLTVVADAHLLQRAVANLLRNAVRYAGDRGPITVNAVRDDRETILTITDSGPGVTPEALPRLFEPFFRPEDSRSRELGGTGLGLAIVKTCIDACRGTVSASNLAPSGFEVTIRLPAAPA